jgi:hypothetical protein
MAADFILSQNRNDHPSGVLIIESMGKQKTLSIGSYPEVSLPNARSERTKLREQVAKSIDPAKNARPNVQAKAERTVLSRLQENGGSIKQNFLLPI